MPIVSLPPEIFGDPLLPCGVVEDGESVWDGTDELEESHVEKLMFTFGRRARKACWRSIVDDVDEEGCSSGTPNLLTCCFW